MQKVSWLQEPNFTQLYSSIYSLQDLCDTNIFRLAQGGELQ